MFIDFRSSIKFLRTDVFSSYNCFNNLVSIFWKDKNDLKLLIVIFWFWMIDYGDLNASLYIVYINCKWFISLRITENWRTARCQILFSLLKAVFFLYQTLFINPYFIKSNILSKLSYLFSNNFHIVDLFFIKFVI